VTFATTVLADFDVRVVEHAAPAAVRTPVTLLLHGFNMRADDLAPFGASLGVPGIFLFPEGPLDLAARGLPGRAWWMIDIERRDHAMARGEERDLAHEYPPDLPAARARLEALVAAVRARWPDRPLLLGGFSQGAILSTDLALRASIRPDGLVLLSTGRVTAQRWDPLFSSLRDLPIFQSHGRNDRELSFAPAQGLRDRLVAAGALVTWIPFDGGHEISLPVLRQLKRFVRSFVATAPASPGT
jgi:phospholipase/carboxylesterase